MRFGTIRTLTLCLLLVTAGCAAPPASAVDPLGGAPEDFSLDITVSGGDADATSATPAGRFVLFADGSLHHAEDPGDSAGWLPPRRRVLDRRQVAGIWSLLQQVGFDDSSSGDPIVNFNLVKPDVRHVTVLAAITGDGHRWTFVRSAPSASEVDPGLDRLVRHLAALAWANGEATVQVAEPLRYDFGDDPYAQYR